MSHDHPHPHDDRTPDQPHGGPRRSTVVPLVMTLLVLAAVVGLFVLITFVADYRSTNG